MINSVLIFDKSFDQMHKVPTSLKALVVKQFRSRDFEIVERAVPKLEHGEALIKVHAAPINPLDLLRIDGQVPGLKLPFTPGSECSGIVIDANHHHKQRLLGKRVSSHAIGGGWAEYVVTKADNMIVHENPDVDMDQAACGWVNPLTAYGMYFNAIHLLKSAGIAITAGNSNLAKTLLKISNKEKTPLISIVRSQSKVAELLELGQQEDRILVSEDKEFPQKYSELLNKYNVKVLYDCIAGPFAGTLLNGLPKGAKYFNFGSLSGEPIGGIDPTNMRFKELSIQGYVVFNFIGGMQAEEKKCCLEYVRDNFELIGHTQIIGSTSFDAQQIGECVEKYKQDMSKGKYLIKMSD